MSENSCTGAPTFFCLMAQYHGLAVVPLERVCADYFAHLTVQKLLRKCLSGEIQLPIIRIERRQKCWKGVHISDLANYLDKRREAALKERDQLCGRT